jgi:hypothetical protein
MGHVVGISEHCGHALTYKVLNAKTLKVVHCSLLCPAKPDDLNVCAESLGGENKDVTQSWDDIDNNLMDPKHPITLTPPTIVDTKKHIERTFLMDAQPDGNKFRARILKMIEDHDYKVENNKKQINFLLSINKDTSEEIITYNQQLDYLAKDDNYDVIWKFKVREYIWIHSSVCWWLSDCHEVAKSVCWHLGTDVPVQDQLDLSPFILVWTSSGMKTTHYASHQSSTLRNWWWIMSECLANSQSKMCHHNWKREITLRQTHPIC